MFAILSDRGRQYKVQEGDLLRVDKLAAKQGEEIVFESVLVVSPDGGELKVGSPHVAGAKVKGIVEGETKGEKTIAHHRVRTNSLGRRKGHRTKYSVVRIQKIEA